MTLHRALRYQKSLKQWNSKKAKRKTHNRIQKKVKIWFKILGTFLNANYEGIDKTIPLIEKYRGVIRLLRDQLQYEDYLFSGAVIYEEYKTKEDLESNMNYISDRWGDHYRLSWMLELPEKYKNAD